MNSKTYNNKIPPEVDWHIAEGAVPEKLAGGSTGSSEYSESSLYSHLSYNPVIKII